VVDLGVCTWYMAVRQSRQNLARFVIWTTNRVEDGSTEVTGKLAVVLQLTEVLKLVKPSLM
jgi:hypothetical protein